MRKRFISGLIGTIILIAMIAIGGSVYFFGILAFALIAYNELLRSFSAANNLLFVIVCNIMIACQFILAYMKINIAYDYYLMGSAFILLTLMVFFDSIAIKDIVKAMFGFLYPTLPLLMLAEFGYGPVEDSIYFVILILINSACADIFAYLVGMSFGKHKLCPKISPKKTIEGSIGGFIGAVLVSLCLGFFYTQKLAMGIPLYHFLLLGAMSGILAQIGDLIASRIKRFYNIKDFGKIMPGHGGILDRIDSLVLVSFVSLLYINYFIV